MSTRRQKSIKKTRSTAQEEVSEETTVVEQDAKMSVAEGKAPEASPTAQLESQEEVKAKDLAQMATPKAPTTGSIFGSASRTGNPTPSRISREDERNELQELNRRLEFYILKQRERDASAGSNARELELMKERTDAEVRNLRTLFDNQLDQARKTRDELTKELSRMRDEKAARDNLVQQQAAELASLEKYKSAVEEKNRELAEDLRQTKTKVFELEDENTKLKHELAVFKTKTETLRQEQDKQRDRADTVSSRVQVAESKAAALAEDLDIERKRANFEIHRLETKVSELVQKNARNEDEIRKEFHKQMIEALAQRQQQYEDDKNEGLAALKSVYDEKMAAFREELEKAGHDFEMERNNNKALQTELSRLNALNTELVAVRQSLATRIAELEEMLKQERLKPNKIVAEKNEIIRRIKAAFKRKDQEFDELMDIKIALAMEIKAYRAMLENEESRLGYKSPLKKRKTASNVGAAPTPSAVDSKDSTSSLLISGQDLNGQYITIRNGSTETVPLAGWSLRSKNKNREFKFPENVRLRPGDSFTVRTSDAVGAKTTGLENTPNQAWSSDVWDNNGDEALLVDPEGETIARVEVIPNVNTPAKLDQPDFKAGLADTPAQRPPVPAFSFTPGPAPATAASTNPNPTPAPAAPAATTSSEAAGTSTASGSVPPTAPAAELNSAAPMEQLADANMHSADDKAKQNGCEVM